MRKVALCRSLLCIVITALILFSCSEVSSEEESIFGTWRLISGRVINCTSDNVSFDFSQRADSCMDFPEGRVCNAADFVFTESGTLMINLIQILDFDNNKEVDAGSFTLVFDLISETILEVCDSMSQSCDTWMYGFSNNNLVLMIEEEGGCVQEVMLERKG